MRSNERKQRGAGIGRKNSQVQNRNKQYGCCCVYMYFKFYCLLIKLMLVAWCVFDPIDNELLQWLCDGGIVMGIATKKKRVNFCGSIGNLQKNTHMHDTEGATITAMLPPPVSPTLAIIIIIKTTTHQSKKYRLPLPVRTTSPSAT